MRRRSPLPQRVAGFTLLEIIVVVLVFSVMAAMAYGGLNTVLRTREGIEAAMTRTAELQRAFLRLRTDLQNLRDRPVRDGFGDAEPAFSSAEKGPVSLVRGGWRSPLDSSRSSLERVIYTFEDGELRRASHPVLDLPQRTDPVELTLLTGVEEVRWRFLDATRQWQDRWPPRARQSGDRASLAAVPPPLAVELILVTRDWGELRLLFRTPVSQLATGTGGGSGLLTVRGLLPARAAGATPSPSASDDPTEPESPEEPTPDAVEEPLAPSPEPDMETGP